MGHDLSYDKHCKFNFSSYVEAHKYCKVTNDMEEQKVSGICLGPTENFQGRYAIISLKTGRVITCKKKILEIPMPTWVIQRADALAMRDGRDLYDGNELMFVDSALH